MDGLRQLVYPDNCFLCKTFLNSNHQQQLCKACTSKIIANVPPFCVRCSRHQEHFSDDSLCVQCRDQALEIDRLWGCCLYTEPLSHLIHAFKYQGKTALRKTFIPIMHDFVIQYHLPYTDFDLMSPIPLHPVRLRERGYNQSALLSHGLSERLNMPHDPDVLIRTVPTPSQTGLSQKQRWTNTQGAFKMNPSKKVADKSILLVDDLLTTKATANAAATALKEAGAAHVGIITLSITS